MLVLGTLRVLVSVMMGVILLGYNYDRLQTTPCCSPSIAAPATRARLLQWCAHDRIGNECDWLTIHVTEGGAQVLFTSSVSTPREIIYM